MHRLRGVFLCAAMGCAVACTASQSQVTMFTGPGLGKNIRNVASSNELEGILNAESFVFLAFYMENCGPCKLMAPRMRELAGRYAGKVTFVCVDATACPDVAREYKVYQAPDMRLIRDRQVVSAWQGFQRTEVLVEAIEAALTQAAEKTAGARTSPAWTVPPVVPAAVPTVLKPFVPSAPYACSLESAQCPPTR